MAKEFLLIPRIRYEHLLKQAESRETPPLPQQVGGANENGTKLETDGEREVNREGASVEKPELETGGEREIKREGPSVGNSASGNESFNAEKEKPHLYVERALSGMAFKRKQKSNESKTRKNAKKPMRKWINYLA